MMVTLQVVLFLLGCIMDPFAILMLVMPMFIPVVKALGFDVLWFEILFVINMQMGFITPPFGYNLFYMKGVITEDMDISIGDIYRSALPFVALQAIGLAIVIAFPPIATWLPAIMLQRKF